jgi:hypothetical protein
VHSYAHAREEKVVATSQPPDPKSAQLDVGTSTTARSAETLEGGKIAIPMRMLSKGSVGTYPDTLQRKAPQIEGYIRRNNAPMP